MSKVFAGFHIVFATKSRRRTIPKDEKRRLYAYLHSVITDKKCKTFRINGMSDHVHIALDLNPTIALSDLVRDLKRSSSKFMQGTSAFPDFAGWAEGYFAESFSHNDRDGVIAYIMNQEEHHIGNSIEQEIEWLTLKAGLTYFPDDYK